MEMGEFTCYHTKSYEACENQTHMIAHVLRSGKTRTIYLAEDLADEVSNSTDRHLGVTGKIPSIFVVIDGEGILSKQSRWRFPAETLTARPNPGNVASTRSEIVTDNNWDYTTRHPARAGRAYRTTDIDIVADDSDGLLIVDHTWHKVRGSKIIHQIRYPTNGLSVLREAATCNVLTSSSVTTTYEGVGGYTTFEQQCGSSWFEEECVEVANADYYVCSYDWEDGVDTTKVRIAAEASRLDITGTPGQNNVYGPCRIYNFMFGWRQFCEPPFCHGVCDIP